MSFIKKIAELIILTVLTLSLLIFSVFLYVRYLWPNAYFDQIYGTIKDLDYSILSKNIYPKDIFFGLLTFIITWPFFCLKLNLKQQLCAVLGALLGILYLSGWISYVINSHTTSDLYEKEYVSAQNLTTEFPAKKRNLVLIFLESFEQNFSSAEHYDKNLIPHIQSLQKEGNYSLNHHSVYGTDYSIAALVSDFCGIPLKNKEKRDIWEARHFLPQVTCFPEILQNNGYQTKIIKAADISFSHAEILSREHGYDEALGIYELQKEYPELTAEQYSGTFGGLNDRTLFEYAKKELAKFDSDQPFMLTLFTLDTHTPGHYTDPDCQKTFNDIRDAFMCTDKLAYEFVDWLKNSPYWQNTTVILIGDHVFPSHLKTNGRTRHGIFNIFLNLPKGLIIDKNKEFTTLDLAPTILESLNIKLSPRALGLGRSIFAKEDTLIKKMKSSLNNKIKQKSELYLTFHNPKEPRQVIYVPYTLGTTLHEQDFTKYSDAWEEYVGTVYLDRLNLLLDQTPLTDLSLHLIFKAITDPKKPIFIKANNQELLTFMPPAKKASPLFTVDLTIKKEWITDNKLQLILENTKGTANAMQLGISPVELTISPKP